MVFVSKREKTGGRQKGTANISTQNARKAIAALVEDNAPKMQAWLAQIAEEQGPAAAWRCMMDVIEYHIPKLQRTEITGEDGGPLYVAEVPPALTTDQWLRLRLPHEPVTAIPDQDASGS